MNPYTNRDPNPNLPPIVADAFVAFMRDNGFMLDNSYSSLIDPLDQILDIVSLFECSIEVKVDKCDLKFDVESAASAYIGNVLATTFNGIWAGHFSTESIVNFYCSQLLFGEFCLYPICWLSYRITHGREEGSTKDWLERIKPSIEARKDLTPQSGFITDIY